MELSRDDMSENVVYRPARESDIPMLVSLINSQYIRKKTGDYFHWQYFNSCYETVLMCAFKNDALIGTFGLQKRMLRNRLISGQAIDLLVAPEWRGKGIFGELGRRATEFFQDLDILCVLPNANGKIAAERALGWKTIGKIDSMCKNVSKEDGAREMKEHEHSVVFDRHDFMQFVYSATIRKWRFEKNPIYKYDYVKLDSASFAVTKIFEDPVTHKRYGDIVDFECQLLDPDRLADLFKAASKHLQQQHVDTVTTWALPGTPLLQAIKSLGFTVSPQERYFCVKALKPQHEFLYDYSCWHLVQADAEIY
jgi:GNAT superfamily N-acetyltransferase